MRKRCWKTVLSAVLAAAMLITSAPANLSMTVQAQEPGVEDTLLETMDVLDDNEQNTDEETGKDAGEDQNAQKPVGEGTNVVTTTEGEEGEKTGENTTPGTQTGNTEGKETPGDSTDGNDGQNGATTANAETGAVVNGQQVTFICVPEAGFFENDLAVDAITSIVVKGGAEGSGWSDLAELKDDDGDKVWESEPVTLPAATYNYKFVANGGTYSSGANKTFTIEPEASTEDSMSDITIEVNADSAALPAKLNCFLATGSTTTEEVDVEYLLTDESQTAGVELAGSVGSQTISKIPESLLVTKGGTGKSP